MRRAVVAKIQAGTRRASAGIFFGRGSDARRNSGD
jgi:hypothetical protein